MRILEIILVLLVAVACDAGGGGDGVDQPATALAALATVAELASELDDGGAENGGSAVDGTAVATPSAVPETESGDDVRGVVIDGFCPADVAPERVGPARDSAKRRNPWELFGTAYPDRIALEWGAAPVPGVTDYVVTRLSRYITDRVSFYHDAYSLTPGSVRTFTIDSVPDKGEYVDTSEIEPRTVYRYRVFPVTADGLGFPTAPLEISSPPAEAPSAPMTASASFTSAGGDGSWYIRANYVFGESVSGMRVLRRPSGDAQWRIVHDDAPSVRVYGSRSFGLGYDSWTDKEVDPNVDYEYAVCFANAAGFGRAVLADASRDGDPEPETVAVDPPRDITAKSFTYPVTVYWLPSSDPSVTGYRVERQPVDQDDIYRLYDGTSDRIANHVTFYNDSASQSKFRVRAVTADGQGPWSEWVGVDINDAGNPQTEPSQPEIVTLTATHSQVYLVWSTEDSLDGLSVRYLRRQSGTTDGAWTYYGCFDWLDPEDVNWDYWCRRYYASFTDEYDVRPDTEYEYAVQVIRGEDVSKVSDPVTVRTKANPSNVERRPLPLYDLESIPTSDGVMLTWELPDDPALKGILVKPKVAHHDLILSHAPVVLPPDQTELLVLTRGFDPEPRRYWFDLETFNDYGTQSVGHQRAYVSAEEMVHCRAIAEEVLRAEIGHHLTIRFRGCEESSTQVVRRELTADGFQESRIDQPCTWMPSEYDNSGGTNRYEGTVKCDYEDTSVKPGTWYVYELTQTYADGREFTSYHEIVTSPRRDVP